MTDRLKKTVRVDYAMGVAGLFTAHPEAQRERLRAAYRWGREEALARLEGIGFGADQPARVTEAMPERDTPEWLDWWKRYYDRRDVQDATVRARRHLARYVPLEEVEGAA